jgi:hypothetical protein
MHSRAFISGIIPLKVKVVQSRKPLRSSAELDSCKLRTINHLKDAARVETRACILTS